jgi:hypothetical protein
VQIKPCKHQVVNNAKKWKNEIYIDQENYWIFQIQIEPWDVVPTKLLKHQKGFHQKSSYKIQKQ